MSATLEFIRRHILELPPYEPILPLDVLSEELGIPVEDLIKLDANENPYGLLPEVKEALAGMNTLHIYPDPESRRIRQLLSEYHQVPQRNLVIGAGADELIDLIVRMVIEPGDTILNCPPTFGMYAFDGALNHARLVNAPRLADFSLDLRAIELAVEAHQPKLLFLANPNNPDGGVISERDFQRLVSLPLLLVIDEAYIQFSDRGRSYLGEAVERPNLFVLRTFSKWAGLAGLRIGYGVFPEAFVPVIMKSKQPYNVSAAAEKAAVITMQNVQKVIQVVARIVEQRGFVYSELAHISWLKAYPSEANFILCKVEGASAEEVARRLRRQGILIRYFDKPGLSDYIRISIGTKIQNERLIAALKGIR